MTNIIITNACRYAGPDATQALTGEDRCVFCHDLSFTDAAARLAFEKKYPGVNTLSESSPEQAIAEAMVATNTIDVLFANHFQRPEMKLLEDTEVDEFRATLETLLVDPYRFIKAVLPALKQSTAGRIVLVTSAAGLRPGANISLYAAARAGANTMVKSLSRELGPDGIGVFGIAPNYFTGDDTYPRDAFENNERLRAMVERSVPLKRISNDNEMSRLIHYLCLDESTFITGQVIGFSGGWL